MRLVVRLGIRIRLFTAERARRVTVRVDGDAMRAPRGTLVLFVPVWSARAQALDAAAAGGDAIHVEACAACPISPIARPAVPRYLPMPRIVAARAEPADADLLQRTFRTAGVGGAGGRDGLARLL
jgi:hypothetical protein